MTPVDASMEAVPPNASVSAVTKPPDPFRKKKLSPPTGETTAGRVHDRARPRGREIGIADGRSRHRRRSWPSRSTHPLRVLPRDLEYIVADRTRRRGRGGRERDDSGRRIDRRDAVGSGLAGKREGVAGRRRGQRGRVREAAQADDGRGIAHRRCAFDGERRRRRRLHAERVGIRNDETVARGGAGREVLRRRVGYDAGRAVDRRRSVAARLARRQTRGHGERETVAAFRRDQFRRDRHRIRYRGCRRVAHRRSAIDRETRGSRRRYAQRVGVGDGERILARRPRRRRRRIDDDAGFRIDRGGPVSAARANRQSGGA